MSWEERAFERSVAVQRSRERIAQQVRQMLDAAQRLIEVKGDEFTTQELVAEAGVALQTFYRYFGSKDELLLAVIGDAMTDACERWSMAAAQVDDPVDRLRMLIITPLQRLHGDDPGVASTRFIVSARWRLHRTHPEELAKAERPFLDLLRAAIAEAVEAGGVKPENFEWDSWFLVEQIRAVYHHYAFTPATGSDIRIAEDHLWRFCLTALGGSA